MHIKNQHVLLISDVADNFDSLDLSRFDLEVSERDTIADIIHGIETNGYICTHLDDPQLLSAAFAANHNAVVLSIWSGENNRNRRAIVPSICEAHGVDYIGADPYAAMISGDKELSKSICSEFGLNTPPGILIRREDQWGHAAVLNYPIVVKPLMEGGSIGITQDSKVSSVENAQRQISALLRHHEPPILCEEFIGGREISFCIVGSENIAHIEAMEVRIEGESDYFENKLFSMHDKRSKDRKKKHQFINVTEEMPLDLINRVKSIYTALGKIDYMRIDGKYTGEFWCLELSTDPGISTISLFAHSYYSIGKSYLDMISDILSTRLRNEGGDT
ncbi:hypothetical protein [Coralliovum pocilloporae]|uniref:hypothetical protein n=1 Tax=Coralliovum pocilloporae TaxID=3066369 RepID=UPI0033073907